MCGAWMWSGGASQLPLPGHARGFPRGQGPPLPRQRNQPLPKAQPKAERARAQVLTSSCASRKPQARAAGPPHLERRAHWPHGLHGRVVARRIHEGNARLVDAARDACRAQVNLHAQGLSRHRPAGQGKAREEGSVGAGAGPAGHAGVWREGRPAHASMHTCAGEPTFASAHRNRSTHPPGPSQPPNWWRAPPDNLLACNPRPRTPPMAALPTFRPSAIPSPLPPPGGCARTSSTSALPQRLDTERLPCLATLPPAAATSTDAPVEIFTLPMPSPPVPTMSTTTKPSWR